MTTKHFPPGYDHSKDIPQEKKKPVSTDSKTKTNSGDIQTSPPRLPRSFNR